MAKTTVPGLYIADGAITAAKLSSTLDLSGVTITVATASTGDSDTSVASTAFVQQEIAALVDSSPSALNTLNELAAAIGDDASFSTTVTNSIATKLPLAGGTLTGNLIINTTGSIQIPVGTTAQRPTAAQGQLRFNTTTSKPEIYNGSAWADVGGGVESVNSATGVVVLTTANITENTNLYYTDARADARIAAATTDDLSEGSTNLYFTTARANSAFDGRLSGSTGVTVSNGAVSIGQDIATSTSPTFQNLTLSGTDSIKVPSGTTAQRSGSPANGMLRYNSSTNEFEGYADSAWGAIGGDTTSSVDLYTATGNGSTSTYDTGKNPQSENNTWVFIGGVYQPKSTYSFSGTQITLSENLPNGEDLEVITGTVSTYNPTDAILGQYNVTTSNTASYDTSLTTENENNVFVFVDGVYQPKSSYTYSGSTLTLDAVPTSGMSLEVLVTRSMNAATVTTGFLADDAVTTVKILDANVTAGKLASSLDLTGKTVTVATASAGDNDTSVASTAFVRQEITSLVDSAPAAMDTLNELAAALGDDANFSTTVNNSIALKAPLASPTFTGNAVFDTTTLFVNSSNNRVGIGTTSPESLVHIKAADSVTGVLKIEGGKNTVTSNGEINSQLDFGSNDISVNNTGNIGGRIASVTEADNGAYTGMAFYTFTQNAGTDLREKVRITHDGEVGIGTSSPAALLHLKSTTNSVGPTLIFENTNNAQSMNIDYYNNAGAVQSRIGYDEGPAAFSFKPNVSATAMYIAYNGNVGIGETSPLGKLHVKEGDSGQGSVNANFDQLVLEDDAHSGMTILSGTSSDGGIYFGDSGGNNLGQFKYKHSSNSFTFATNNGSESLIIDSSGNVGIGRTDPTQVLEVHKASGGDQTVAKFSAHNYSDTGKTFIEIGTEYGDGSSRIGSFNDTGNKSVLVFDTHSATSGQFTERMRIDSSGDVLIGQTSQTGYAFAQKLVVGDGDNNDGITIQSGSTHQGNLAFNHSDGTTAHGRISYQHGTNYMQFFTNNTERMRITSAGSVGIGTTSPQTSTKGLHVVHDATEGTPSFPDGEVIIAQRNFNSSQGCHIGIIAGSAGESAINFGDKDNSDVGNITYNHSANRMEFATNAAERMRIDSSGNLLVGATSGSLDNAGFIARPNDFMSYVNTTTDTGDRCLLLNKENATGTLAEWRYSNSTVGTITITGSSTSYNTSSDYRLKENVDYDFNALDRVAQLKPARFNFIVDADTTVDGFIAHEVQDIVPEAVTGEKDAEEMQCIDQSKLVPLLTKAIQEQQTIIDDLKSRLDNAGL